MVLLTLRQLALYSSILTSLVLAAPLKGEHLAKRTAGILWGACDAYFEELKVKGGYNGPIHCANLTVPLDYTNKSSSATIQLNLIKAPVPGGNSKGTVQFNFGGPGIVGRESLAPAISTYQAYAFAIIK
jgi:hypothetical protein